MDVRGGDGEKLRKEGKIREDGGCTSASSGDKDHSGSQRNWCGMLHHTYFCNVRTYESTSRLSLSESATLQAPMAVSGCPWRIVMSRSASVLPLVTAALKSAGGGLRNG